MKKLIIFAAAAVLLTACSSNEELNVVTDSQETENGILFDVYTQRAQSRAGIDSTVTTATLQSGRHSANGFGVFAYHTNNSTYDADNSVINFMYNTQVTYKDGQWVYEPVKFWPNQYGQDATSTDYDFVSFFAYAPWVKVNAQRGVPSVADGEAEQNILIGAFKAEKMAELIVKNEQFDELIDISGLTYLQLYCLLKNYITDDNQFNEEAATVALQKEYNNQIQNLNITQLIPNAQTGDPYIKYVVDTKPMTSVDLLWGVAADDNGFAGMSDQQESVSGGNAFINLSKQSGVNEKVKWNFKHALARLNVQISTVIDAATDGTGTSATLNDDETKIYLRSIKFNGFTNKGMLNLHSADAASAAAAKPMWFAYDGTSQVDNGITFYDGLKDGREGTNNNLQATELPQGLNPSLIEWRPFLLEDDGAGQIKVGSTDYFWDDKNDGILETPANLFAGAKSVEQPIFVIPTGNELEVGIEYDIQTRINNLAGVLSDGITHGRTVENFITQTVKDADGNPLVIEAGKSYTVKIYLGLTSVKFDVIVTPWKDNDTDYDIPAADDDDPSGDDPSGDDDDDTPVDIEVDEYTASGTIDGVPFGPTNVALDTQDPYFVFSMDGTRYAVMKEGAKTNTRLPLYIDKTGSSDFQLLTDDYIIFKEPTTALNATKKALSYSYEDYSYNGTFGTPETQDAAGNVVLTYTARTPFDGTQVMNDLARMLGALYRANGGDVNSLTWNSNDFNWDETTTEPTNLKGSNWRNAGGTLVSQIVAAYNATPFTQLTLGTNLGQNITIQIQ